MYAQCDCVSVCVSELRQVEMKVVIFRFPSTVSFCFGLLWFWFPLQSLQFRSSLVSIFLNYKLTKLVRVG